MTLLSNLLRYKTNIHGDYRVTDHIALVIYRDLGQMFMVIE